MPSLTRPTTGNSSGLDRGHCGPADHTSSAGPTRHATTSAPRRRMRRRLVPLRRTASSLTVSPGQSGRQLQPAGRDAAVQAPARAFLALRTCHLPAVSTDARLNSDKVADRTVQQIPDDAACGQSRFRAKRQVQSQHSRHRTQASTTRRWANAETATNLDLRTTGKRTTIRQGLGRRPKTAPFNRERVRTSNGLHVRRRRVGFGLLPPAGWPNRLDRLQSGRRLCW